MPARRCPECKLVNPGSATHCDCGFSFDGGPRRLALEVAKAQAACPMCGNPAPERPCACGYGFDDEHEDLRGLLLHRLTIGWVWIGGGILLIGLFLFLIVLQMVSSAPRIYFPIAAVSGAAIAIKRGVRIVRAARRPLRELDARAAALPRAVIKR